MAESVGYRFYVWEQPTVTPEGALIELGCLSDAEAYALAIKLLAMIGFKVHNAQLQNWKGEHMMYYLPKKGWYFGDDRDRATP